MLTIVINRAKHKKKSKALGYLIYIFCFKCVLPDYRMEFLKIFPGTKRFTANTKPTSSLCSVRIRNGITLNTQYYY